jgi:peptidoglycan-N-acetylglucosamine deacetylase
MRGSDPCLRNGRPLLNTRIPLNMSPSSLAARVLFAFFLGITVARAEPAAPSPAPASPNDHPIAAPSPSPEPRISFSYVHVDGPYIALTFDDGPDKKLTPKLLDLLAAHHIKATFFVIGQNVAAHPEIVARAAREGHEIGNHSWSHPNLGKMSDEAVRRQLRQTDDAILRATGSRPVLLRPPYGSLTARQKRWIHDEFGYQIILWDVDPLDWKRPGPTAICNRIMAETRPGSIVLSHDIHAGTIAAMPQTLAGLEAKGFKFVTVSQLLSMAKAEKPKQPTTARVPSSTAPAASPTPRSKPLSGASKPTG